MGDNLTTWDLVIPRGEFAFNASANRTTRMSPFEVAHGLVPRKPLDLVPVDPHIRASEDGVAFAKHVSELHKYNHDRITQQNAAYKQAADSHHRHRSFEVGDQVMVRLRPERYSPCTATKLHAHSVGPFRVLSHVGENAYVVDIPPSWRISSTFNVADLAAYLALPPHQPFSKRKTGGVRPPSPPRHDTTAPEEPTPARVQPPRQAKTKDAEFHYTK